MPLVRKVVLLGSMSAAWSFYGLSICHQSHFAVVLVLLVAATIITTLVSSTMEVK